jgi:hypothetical protein
MQRAGGAARHNRRYPVRRRRVYLHPGARVGLEDLWQSARAAFGMDATPWVPLHRDALIATDTMRLFGEQCAGRSIPRLLIAARAASVRASSRLYLPPTARHMST